MSSALKAQRRLTEIISAFLLLFVRAHRDVYGLSMAYCSRELGQAHGMLPPMLDNRAALFERRFSKRVLAHL